MTSAEMQQLLDTHQDDDAVVSWHGFVDYMRDYEIICPRYRGVPLVGYNVFQFVGCLRATCESTVDPTVFISSMSDQHVHYDSGSSTEDQPDGLIWGVRSSSSLLGIELVEDCETEQISARYGSRFHKARVRTEVFDIAIIFLELRVERIDHFPQGLRREPVPTVSRSGNAGGCLRRCCWPR